MAAPAMMLPSPTMPPTLAFSPTPPNTTLTQSPTDTITLTCTFTGTPFETSTSLPASTPTATPNLFTYVFPVQPPKLAGFSKGGHPYPAADIFAPAGTKFVAVTSGTVDEVSYVDNWNPATNLASTAGGLSVRIFGDDGMHYYGAHLSAIARGIRPGVWVPAGQLLGLVGNTGDARFTAPHLHFEVSSPNPPFTKLDPFPLLTAWLAGQQITPLLPTP
jgi:murein DD-endopeptidase MepM/ murein hydrolase activator NlpD